MSVTLEFMHPANSNSLISSSSCSSEFAPNSANAIASKANHVKVTKPKDYEIVKATNEDVEEILEFMLKDFLRAEPLNAALGVSSEEACDFFADIIRCNLSDNLSYIVRQKPSEGEGGGGGGGRIVAIRLSGILSRPNATPNSTSPTNDTSDAATIAPHSADSNEPKASAFSTAKSKNNSHKIQQIENFLEELEGQTWKILPAEFRRLLSIVVLSVDEAFTRRGIARQLINHNLEEARAVGCQAIVTEATAFNSQQLFAKSGYERLYEIAHSSWRDANGQQIFRCDDRTDCATLDFKAL